MPFAEVGDAQVYYRVRPGAHPPVVCVHGFRQSSLYWEPTLDLLAEAGTLAIAPDLPGFGESANAPGPYTMEGYADCLAALLDRLGASRTIVVGGSMGGVVAQQFALRHPDRLQRLLLVATGAAPADPSAALAKAEAMVGTSWTSEEATAAVNGFFHRQMPEQDLRRYREIALLASPAAAAVAARSNAQTSSLAALDRIAVPTLIIQGREDRGRTPEHGAELQRRIPDSRLVVLDDAGHTPQLEQPDAFHAVALPFLLGSTTTPARR